MIFSTERPAMGKSRKLCIALNLLLSIVMVHRMGLCLQIEKITPQQTYEKMLRELELTDSCKTIYTSKLSGYDLKTYKVTTKDGYNLHIHRLVHPSEIRAAREGLEVEKKKPYLLIHGLLGSSASFVRGAWPGQFASKETYKMEGHIRTELESNKDKFTHQFVSCADQFRGAHEEGKPKKFAYDQHPKFATSAEINYENDHTFFGSAYRQAHRKVRMPTEAYNYVSNSLAFTLANFNYDVWMINLRGNYYSRTTNTHNSYKRAEYWNFDIDTLVRHDILATLEFIKKEKNCDDPIGLISYSYSSMYVLNMMKNFPLQMKEVQPVIMMAPTLSSGQSNPSRSKKVLLRSSSELLLPKVGPFPSLGRGGGEGRRGIVGRLEFNFEKLFCNLPVTSRVCHLLETVLYGRTKSVTSLTSDSQEQLVRDESRCGQTSTKVLLQIVSNLKEGKVMPNFSPQDRIHQGIVKKTEVRRSVILVHSEDDDISTPTEVQMIREKALLELTLVDYKIVMPNFGHTDFLYSRNNKYTVNAEIARMASIYDHLLYEPKAPALPPRPTGLPPPRASPRRPHQPARQK